MARPLVRGQPPAIRRAGRMVGRISLGLLAFGTTVMSFGLAIGIGSRLEDRGAAGRESVAVRNTAQSEASETTVLAGEVKNATATAAVGTGVSLQAFHAALKDLESGQRNKPVTILHLGDGHISGDRLDAHMRTLLQGRFGDAGRGMLQPAGVLKGYRARGLRFETVGSWTSATALESPAAVLGLSGVTATAASAQSEMTVSVNEGRFDSVEVAFLTGPDRGAASIGIDGRPHSIVTRTPEVGVQRARLPSGGVSLSVKPSGTGPITVLSWSLLKNRAGIRYAGLGLPGGGIDTIEKLDELILIDDLRALRPDLVILGYGGAEAMDDKLDIAQYHERFTGLLRLFKRLVPDASIAVVGPPDINRVPDFAARLRTSASTGCRALNPDERQQHDALLAAGDERLARWYSPPRLEDVRQILQRAAQAQAAFYWDWSKVMGGECGMHSWVHAKPELALPDHTMLTDEGYQRSARAFYGDLLQGFGSAQAPANKQAAQR
jgi:lysophospholipase L1-like esterase